MGESEYKGYFLQVAESAKRQKIRGYGLPEMLPPGIGTIYSWDFAYSLNVSLDKNTKAIDKSTKNALRFRYIGLAAQITTQKRITQHVGGAESKRNRKFYNVLSEAIRQSKVKKNDNSFALPKSIATSEAIVRVVHFVSLFDLASLENYMVQKDSDFGNLSSGEKTFSQMIQDNSTGNKAIGLNSSNDAGEGDPLGGGGAKKDEDFIIGAYIYLTEDDNLVMKARQLNNLPDADQILQRNKIGSKIDYTQSIVDLISLFKKSYSKTGGLPNNEKDSSFLRKVDSLISGISEKDLSVRGFKTDSKTNVIFGSKFPSSLQIQLTFDFLISTKKIKAQAKKTLFIKRAFESWDRKDLKSMSDIEQIFNDVENEYSKELGREATARVVGEKYKKRMGEAYKKQMTPILESIYSGIEKGDGIAYDVLLTETLKNILKRQPTKEELDEFLTINSLAFGRSAAKKDEYYISKKDLEKMFIILEDYMIKYLALSGELPSGPEVAQILGYFKTERNGVVITSKFTK